MGGKKRGISPDFLLDRWLATDGSADAYPIDAYRGNAYPKCVPQCVPWERREPRRARAGGPGPALLEI